MKSKYIAESGILVALILVILYATNILPISTLSILTVSSCIIPISIIRNSLRSTILVYIASSIISFFLVPINIALYFTLFFGIYGIIKYFIEKLRNIFLELLLKLIALNILLIIIYFVMINFLGNFVISFSLYLVWIISQIAFLVYDYSLTLIISFYLNRIHKHL
jgi:hypothetical protein